VTRRGFWRSGADLRPARRRAARPRSMARTLSSPPSPWCGSRPVGFDRWRRAGCAGPCWAPSSAAWGALRSGA